MATKKDTPQQLVDRNRVAWEAAAQIEALVGTIKREAGTDVFQDVLPTLLRRIKELSSVVLSVVGDDHSRELLEMQEVVHG